MYRNVRTVNQVEDAGILNELLVDGYVALVVDDNERLIGLAAKMDLVDYLTKTVGSSAGRGA